MNSRTGAVSGVSLIDVGQSSTFTVRVTDSGNPSGWEEKAFAIFVVDPLLIRTGAIEAGIQGEAYLTTLEGEGGVSPYRWYLDDGAFPKDLQLDIATGDISGTPESCGFFNFTVRLEDSSPAPALTTQAYVLDVTCAKEADISVQMSVDNPSPNMGENVTFTIDAMNHGPNDASSVQVTVLLPAGLTYVSDNSNGAYNPLTGIWDTGGLVNGMSAQLNIVVKVDQQGEIISTSTRSASTPADIVSSNDKGSITIQSLPVVDLSLNLSGSAESVRTGDYFNYTVSITNNGPATATGLALTYALPSGVDFVSATSGQGSCVVNNNVMTCQLGGINADGNSTVSIVVKPLLAGTFTSTIGITSNEPDSNISNNEAVKETLCYEVLSCLGSGSKECLERIDSGNAGNNLDAGKPKVDVEYSFKIKVQDTAGTNPQYVKLLMTQRNKPFQEDFYSYDMTCSGNVTTGAECTYITRLGPAAIHAYYFETALADGAVTKYPESGYLTGPEIQLLNGYNLTGIPRDFGGRKLDGNTAFESILTRRWDADLGNYKVITSANPVRTCEGYFIKKIGTVPEHGGYGDIQELEFACALKPGWNIISNPYSGNVKLSDIKVKKGGGAPVSWIEAAANGWVVNAVYYYNGMDWGKTYSFETTDDDAALVPWSGYWIYVGEIQDAWTIVIPKP